MGENDLNTEEKILEAAAQEFIQKGRSGARMQEIANNAGINKALLHYYYRSKDMLFESVFTLVIQKLLLPKIKAIIEQETDAFALIRKFAETYIEVLNANPTIPFFIIDEIHKNPDRLSRAFLQSELPIDKVLNILYKAMDDGLIRTMDPRQILINLISMCIFPLVGRNMMQPILFDDDKKEFEKFLESRKKEVAEFVIHAIRP
jgi:TetR/AcrR family transcriptional regulator